MELAMKFTLFLLFFITPPGPKLKPGEIDNRVWTFQSSSSIIFDSKDACLKAGNRISVSVAGTDTMTVRGWCFSEGGDERLLGDDEDIIELKPQN